MSSSVKQIQGVLGRNEELRVDPRQIVIVDGFNPRTDLRLEEIKPSIQEHGVLTPIHVCRNAQNQLELVNGERRLRATLALMDEGVDIVSIPAKLVPHRVSLSDRLILALVTNTGVPLEPLDEADAYRRLVAYGHSVVSIAQKVGKSSTHVHNRLTLLQADAPVQEAVQTKTIGTADAVQIVRRAEREGIPQATALEDRKAAKATRQAKKAWTPEEEMQAALRPLLDKYGYDRLLACLDACQADEEAHEAETVVASFA